MNEYRVEQLFNRVESSFEPKILQNHGISNYKKIIVNVVNECCNECQNLNEHRVEQLFNRVEF